MMVSSLYVTVNEPKTGVIKLKIILKNSIDFIWAKKSLLKRIEYKEIMAS